MWKVERRDATNVRRSGPNPVEVRAMAHNISRRPLRPEQAADIVARYEAGERAEVLADEFGCHFQTVYNHIHRAGKRVRQKKASAEQLAAMAADYAQGASLVNAARRFGFDMHV